MAAGGKRKKPNKAKKSKRSVGKALAKGRVEKVKKAKAPPKRAAKRAAKKASKRKVPSRIKTKVRPPTFQDIAPSGEPEFVSNAPPVKL